MTNWLGHGLEQRDIRGRFLSKPEKTKKGTILSFTRQSWGQNVLRFFARLTAIM